MVVMEIIFQILLSIHNLVRWLILILMSLVLIYGILIWIYQKKNQLSFKSLENTNLFKINKKIFFYLFIVINIQFLIGFTLYPLSTLVIGGWNHLSESIKVKEVRFFMVEHPVLMVVLLGIIHAINGYLKKENENFYKIQTFLIVLSFLIILYGVPWFRPIFRLL